MQKRKGRRLKYRVQFRAANGERLSASFMEKKHAEEWYNRQVELRALQRAGLESIQKTLFFDFSGRWLKKRMADYPKATWAPEESKLRLVWLPLLGHREIDKITRREIQAELERLGREGIHPPKDKDGNLIRHKGQKPPVPLSPATRNRHRALLHTIFEAALKEDPPLIRANPASAIPVEVEEGKEQANWTLEHAATYSRIAYSRGTLWGTLATVLHWAGARINEVLALTPADLLWQEEAILIRRTVEIATAQVAERTKKRRTKKKQTTTTHTLPLFPVVAAALRQWLAECPKQDHEPIFTTEAGERLTYWMVENAHHAILEAGGLPRVTLHRFRHFYATQLRRSGLTKNEVQDVLGHASAKTTEGYIHELPDLRHVVRRAGELGFGQSGPL